MTIQDILYGIPLFKNLTGPDLNLVAGRLHKEEHAKGSILFHKGEPGDSMYLVESGQLAVVEAVDGEQIASLGPGNFVGDISLILAQPRTATVQVTIDAQLWRLHKKDFDEVIALRPDIALEMMRELSRRLVTTTRRKRTVAVRRLTALSGEHKGVELSRIMQQHLKSPVALLRLSQTPPTFASEFSDVIVLNNQALTENALAESISHQLEVFKHVIVVLPDKPDALAYKAVELADTIVSIGAPPAWLASEDISQELWVTADSEAALLRTARRLTNRLVGLALSSGGTRGLAHIGVLKVLAEENIQVDMIAGSSAGALFGGLFAAGWSVEKIERYVRNLKNLTRFINWDFNLPPVTGLVKGRRARDRFLARPLENRRIEDLNIPLYVVAADILTGAEVVFDSGSLADALRASAGIPILGSPWHYQGRYLVDGGVVNPLPASVLRERGANLIIASNVVQPLRESYSGPTNQMPHLGQIVFNIISSMEAEMIKKQFPLIDVLIHHCVSAKHSLDFDDAGAVIRQGEIAAQQMMPAIREALKFR